MYLLYKILFNSIFSFYGNKLGLQIRFSFLKIKEIINFSTFSFLYNISSHI